jgi:hypothetical protein
MAEHADRHPSILSSIDLIKEVPGQVGLYRESFGNPSCREAMDTQNSSLTLQEGWTESTSGRGILASNPGLWDLHFGQ